MVEYNETDYAARNAPIGPIATSKKQAREKSEAEERHPAADNRRRDEMAFSGGERGKACRGGTSPKGRAAPCGRSPLRRASGLLEGAP